MLRDEVLSKLKADKQALDDFGVAEIALFGSVARGEETAESDIDIFISYRPEKRAGLIAFLTLKGHLEDLLGRRVDLATKKALHEALRDEILGEAIYV